MSRLQVSDGQLQVTLGGIAADCGCEYRGEPSWRRLIDHIASGKLTVVDKPNKRIQAF